jgi:RNA polymerase sigma-70 factor, ECF subfamily
VRTSEAGFVGEVRELWARDHARLWRSLLAWSGDGDVASDASAEAFAQLLRRGDEVRDPAAWVWTAAFRIAAGQLKSRNGTRSVEQLDEGATPTHSSGADVGESLALVRALSTLDETDRRVVVLSLVAGWTSDEIGATAGLSAGAVRVRLHRARRMLQQHLEVHDD